MNAISVPSGTTTSKSETHVLILKFFSDATYDLSISNVIVYTVLTDIGLS